jgi:hypothetical protein
MGSRAPVDIFHYTGHSNAENNKGYLTANDLKQGEEDASQRLYADALGNLCTS